MLCRSEEDGLESEPVSAFRCRILLHHFNMAEMCTTFSTSINIICAYIIVLKVADTLISRKVVKFVVEEKNEDRRFTFKKIN